VSEAPAAAPYVPAPRYTAPAPEPEPAEPDVAPPDDSGGPCALYDNLLTVLDDRELRAAVSTVC
jgi:hypothetical protein